MSGTVVAGMTRRERIEAAFRGAEVDHLPVTFWNHFPGKDHSAELLAPATVEFAHRFDLDLVRVVPTGMYSVTDYGMVTRLADDDTGSTELVSGPIHGPGDWRHLPRISPHRGALGEQVRTVGLVRAALGPDTPVIQTIFSPFSMAIKLAGGTLGPEILDAGESIHDGLNRMAEDAIAFSLACLDNGADGIFFLAMHAHAGINRAAYSEFGVPYDQAVLEAVRSRAWGVVAHFHGVQPYFDLANRYPLDAISWEDRETSPSLREALSLTDRCLVGGIGRMEPLVKGTPAAIRAQVRDVIAQTDGRRVIVAPGCTLPHGVPDENLDALVAAVHRED